MLEIHLDIDVSDLFGVKIDFDFPVSLDVPKACELVEVATEGIPGVVEGFIASADEAAALDDVVSFVEGRSSEIFVDGVDLEPLEGVDGGNSMLPHIPHHVVEAPCLEHVDRIWRHPILHIHVTDLLIFPACMILLQRPADRVVLVLSG